MINMLTRYSVRNHSSIVFEVIKTISSLFIYFSYEKILSKKKAQKRKRFSPSWKFFLCAQKCVAFVVFCSLVFVLLVGVCLWRVFQNLFIKKKKKTGLKLSWQPQILYYWCVPLSTHLWRIYLFTLVRFIIKTCKNLSVKISTDQYASIFMCKVHDLWKLL